MKVKVTTWLRRGVVISRCDWPESLSNFLLHILSTEFVPHHNDELWEVELPIVINVDLIHNVHDLLFGGVPTQRTHQHTKLTGRDKTITVLKNKQTLEARHDQFVVQVRTLSKSRKASFISNMKSIEMLLSWTKAKTSLRSASLRICSSGGAGGLGPTPAIQQVWPLTQFHSDVLFVLPLTWVKDTCSVPFSNSCTHTVKP